MFISCQWLCVPIKFCKKLIQTNFFFIFIDWKGNWKVTEFHHRTLRPTCAGNLFSPKKVCLSIRPCIHSTSRTPKEKRIPISRISCDLVHRLGSKYLGYQVSHPHIPSEPSFPFSLVVLSFIDPESSHMGLTTVRVDDEMKC